LFFAPLFPKVEKVDNFNISRLYSNLRMGNSPSTSKSANDNKEFENFYEIIDYIATYYILTMDFKSLTKLAQKEYCDELVILTSDIIQKYFNDLEITYLAQRVKEGQEVNELNKDKIIFLKKDQLDSLDIQKDAQKTIKKKRVCIGIAKFYIKIAHVFAAIVTTINPIYVYRDAYGAIVKKGLMEKDKIPKNVPRKIYKLNICDERINSLMEKPDPKNPKNPIDPNSKVAYIQPKLCTMNVNKKDGSVKNLAEEPGIPELMQLYLDDQYDYSTGVFTGMSPETQKKFQQDLKIFYTAFTGNTTMPPEITKFSDIKLRDYHVRNGCQGADPLFKKTYTMDKTNPLFVQYATNLKNMIQSATNKQKELLGIVNELFSFVVDPYSGKKKIRVNPKLTEASLQKMVEASRKIIVDLYVKCETDYVNGIKLYEAIVESKILESTKNQIQSLQKESEKIIQEANIPPSNLSTAL
jgi:hypothetical protein